MAYDVKIQFIDRHFCKRMSYSAWLNRSLILSLPSMNYQGFSLLRSVPIEFNSLSIMATRQ